MNYLGEMKFNDEFSRMSYIKKHWSFDCNCDLCRHNIYASQPDPMFEYIQLNFQEDSISNLKFLVENCQKYLNKYMVTHVRMPF